MQQWLTQQKKSNLRKSLKPSEKNEKKVFSLNACTSVAYERKILIRKKKFVF